MFSTQMETLYQQIGQSIVDAIDDDWSQAWIEVEVDPGAVLVEGFYQNGPDAPTKTFQVSENTMDAFEELHTLMEEAPNGAWEKAIFTLEPSGKFELKFEYSDK